MVRVWDGYEAGSVVNAEADDDAGVDGDGRRGGVYWYVVERHTSAHLAGVVWHSTVGRASWAAMDMTLRDGSPQGRSKRATSTATTTARRRLRDDGPSARDGEAARP